MEPFGLLNLLKTLLPQTENSMENPTRTADKTDGVLGENVPSTDNSCPPFPNTERDPPPFSQAPQNAFLDFVSRHEERKRNIKK